MVKVIDNYFIEPNDFGFTVGCKTQTRVDKKTGAESVVILNPLYYQTLDSAISGILEHAFNDRLKAKSSELASLQDILDEWRKIVDEVKLMLEPLRKDCLEGN